MENTPNTANTQAKPVGPLPQTRKAKRRHLMLAVKSAPCKQPWKTERYKREHKKIRLNARLKLVEAELNYAISLREAFASPSLSADEMLRFAENIRRQSPQELARYEQRLRNKLMKTSASKADELLQN